MSNENSYGSLVLLPHSLTHCCLPKSRSTDQDGIEPRTGAVDDDELKG